jgi:hypothetical protein
MTTNNIDDNTLVNSDTKTVRLEFTDEQRGIIVEVLERVCQGAVCFTRPKLFSLVKDEFSSRNISLDMLEIQFSNILSRDIKDKKINGFAVRRGKTGGVHRIGVFTDHDAKRKKVKKPRVKTPVVIEGRQLATRVGADKLRQYVESVLGGKESADGKVTIDGTTYDCDPENFSRYLLLLDPKQVLA